jgi:hypothetical protein
MHRSRPICPFDTDCQSPVISRELFPSLIRLADLSRLQWVSDRGTGRSAHPRLAAMPLCTLWDRSLIDKRGSEGPYHRATPPAAISLGRSLSPKAGALPHFPPVCRTAQTRSVPGSSSPNCRFRENLRSTPANLPACHSVRVPLAPELQRRHQNHMCCAVRGRQPFSPFYRPL